MLVRSPSVLPEIEDMGITSPSRSFMQQRRPLLKLLFSAPTTPPFVGRARRALCPLRGAYRRSGFYHSI
ncbi:MAG: hypothetical protein VB125_03015 [Burkholderia sp.]